MEKTVRITITEDGKEVVFFETDDNGDKTLQDVATKITSIVGERPIREERR